MALPSLSSITEQILNIMTVPPDGWKEPMLMPSLFEPKVSHLLKTTATATAVREIGDNLDLVNSSAPQKGGQIVIHIGYFDGDKFQPSLPSVYGDNLVASFPLARTMNFTWSADAGKRIYRIGARTIRIGVYPPSVIDVISWGVRLQEEKDSDDVSDAKLRPQFVRETTVPDYFGLTLRIRKIIDVFSGDIFYTVALLKYAPLDAGSINTTLVNLYSRMQNASIDLVLTPTDMRQFAANYNILFGRDAYKTHPGHLYSRYLVKPHILRLEHLLCTNGGKPYWTIMQKYDGVRKQMVLLKEGIFLTSPSQAITCLSRIASGDGTVYDGEWYADTRTFIPFDVAIVNGHDVRNQNFASRIAYAKDLSGTFTIKKPDILSGDISTSLMRLVSTEKTDGIVFIPPGNFSTIKYKWKPENTLSIDFAVDKDGNALVVAPKETGKEYNTQLVPFMGSPSFPSKEPFSIGGEQGKIYECVWKDGKFKHLRERDDKDKPNSQLVAESTFDEMIEPTTIRDLRCVNSSLLHRFVELKLLTDLQEYKIPAGSKVFILGNPSRKWVKQISTLGYDVSFDDDLPTEGEYGAIIAIGTTFERFGVKRSILTDAVENISKRLLPVGGRFFSVFFDYDSLRPALERAGVELTREKAELREKMSKAKASGAPKGTRGNATAGTLAGEYATKLEYLEKNSVPSLKFGTIQISQGTKFVEADKPPTAMKIRLGHLHEDGLREIFMVSRSYLYTLFDKKGVAATKNVPLSEVVASSFINPSTLVVSSTGLDTVYMPEHLREFANMLAYAVMTR